MLTIKTFSVVEVLEGDKVEFNTNNHYYDTKSPPPEDYQKILAKGNTKNWIDRFHKNYHIIDIEEKDIRVMTQIADHGMITGKISKIFSDEIDDLVTKYKSKVPPGKWFIRSESHSLKTGMHKAGPYDNFRSILESMCTTTVTHRCFHNGKACRLYLLPWLDMDYDKEFRIFVCNNKITAISDQHLYSVNDWLKDLGEDGIKKMVDDILVAFEKDIKDKMKYMENYVMDLAILKNGNIYFIEANSFGAMYASGSALFHWIRDGDRLNGKLDGMEIRYCDRL